MKVNKNQSFMCPGCHNPTREFCPGPFISKMILVLDAVSIIIEKILHHLHKLSPNVTFAHQGQNQDKMSHPHVECFFNKCINLQML